jgi:hypothetical protein
LFALQGGKSQVLCHGDDLGAHNSTIATWDARHGALAGTAGGTPTVNGTGWSGAFKTMLLDASTEHMGFDAEAANYGASTAFTWIIAAKFTASSIGRNVLFLGDPAGSNYRGFTINVTNDFAYVSSNRNGSTQFTAGTAAVAESVQGIWVVSLAGGNALVRQGLAGGNTTLLSAAHTMTGTLTVTKFTLGALFFTASPGGYTPGDFRFVSCYRGAGVDAAGADRLIAYTRHRLRCPL